MIMKRANEMPKIRFIGHENEWKQIRLGDALKISRGASPRPIDNFLTDNVNGVNWIKIGDVKSSESFITNTMQRITHEGALKSHKVKKGDLILSNSMSFGRPYILEIDGCIHDGWLHLENFENTFNRDFLQIYLGLNQVKAKYEKMSAGGVVQNLNSDIVRNLVLSVPNILEQEKIASFIMIIGDRIQTQEQIIENLEQLKKGYMQKIFSQQLRFKDENGEDFPEWEEVNLSKITEIKTGSNDVQDAVINGKYPFFDRGATIKYLDSFNYDHEAIIYAGEGSEFIPRYFNGKYALHQRCYTIHNLNIEGYLKYIHHYLTTKNNHFLSTSVGTTVKSLRMQCFDSCIIQLPSKIEQLKILTLFDLFDKKLDIEKQKLIKLQKLKSGYLQQMFV